MDNPQQGFPAVVASLVDAMTRTERTLDSVLALLESQQHFGDSLAKLQGEVQQIRQKDIPTLSRSVKRALQIHAQEVSSGRGAATQVRATAVRPAAVSVRSPLSASSSRAGFKPEEYVFARGIKLTSALSLYWLGDDSAPPLFEYGPRDFKQPGAQNMFIKLKGVARAVLETTKRVQPKDAKQLASILDIAVPMMNPVKTRKRTGEVSVATLYDKVCSTRKHVGAKAGAGAAAARKKAARKKVVQKSPVPKVAIVDLPQQKRKRTK